MPNTDLLRVFRILTQAAARFEKIAARHRRVEAEGKALQEALTDAQLVLSLQQTKALSRSEKFEGRRHSEGFREAARERPVLVPPDLVYRQTIAVLLAELIPREEHDRWMLTAHSALSGDCIDSRNIFRIVRFSLTDNVLLML